MSGDRSDPPDDSGGCDYAAAPDAPLPLPAAPPSPPDAPLPDAPVPPEPVDCEPVAPPEPPSPEVEPLDFVDSPVLPGSALLPPVVSVPPFGVVLLPDVVPESGFVSGLDWGVVSGFVSVAVDGVSQPSSPPSRRPGWQSRPTTWPTAGR
jgi:hypothetical protein